MEASIAANCTALKKISFLVSKTTPGRSCVLALVAAGPAQHVILVEEGPLNQPHAVVTMTPLLEIKEAEAEFRSIHLSKTQPSSGDYQVRAYEELIEILAQMTTTLVSHMGYELFTRIDGGGSSAVISLYDLASVTTDLKDEQLSAISDYRRISTMRTVLSGFDAVLETDPDGASLALASCESALNGTSLPVNGFFLGRMDGNGQVYRGLLAPRSSKSSIGRP